MRSDVILLVDDSAEDVELTVWAFRQSDITNEIVVARDGVEALDLLLPGTGAVPLQPAIVLLDINMPRLGGLAVLQQLRADAFTKTLPVIMLTSSLHDRDIDESYGSGANSYVQKPVDSDEFLQTARALGVYWLNLNQRNTYRHP
jgi:two-component system, response regulator